MKVAAPKELNQQNEYQTNLLQKLIKCIFHTEYSQNIYELYKYLFFIVNVEKEI